MTQLINGFLAAAVPTDIIESFRNAGISLCRDGQEIRCLTTPGTVRRFNAEELMERYSRSTEERQPDEESANLNLETYAMNCQVAMSGEQGEVEGREE
jgi:hypothetical protein